jgi:REP element-mobilizing transposase RayT
MSRGNGRMTIFLDETDYRRFISIMSDVVADHGIDCVNYCVMPNHYHGTFCPTRPNLSDAIRCLNSRYAQWWNRRHGRVGHVFQGRFKDQMVERESYLLALSRYVALNPVRANLVAKPDAWPWSSYRAIAGLAPPPSFLSIWSTLRLFGEDDTLTLQERFTRFVGAGEEPEFSECIRSNERVLGSRLFRDSVVGPPQSVGLESTSGQP